jgi:hypothetical protein
VITLLLGLALLVVGGLGIALLELLIRRADVAAALVFVSVLLEAVFEDRVPALVLPGGVQVYVLLVSLVRGVAAFGMQPSVADFRQYLFFGGVGLYFASFPVSIRLYDRIGRIWLAMTIPMMLLVCARWLAVFAGVNLGVPASKYGADAAIRVIDGPFTFFLASAFVLTIPAWTWMRRERDRWIRWVSVLLLLFCLVLNRRTVWLAIAVGVAVVMLRDRRLGRRALLLVALGAVMTVVAFVWLGGLQEGSSPWWSRARGTSPGVSRAGRRWSGPGHVARWTGPSASRSAAASPAKSKGSRRNLVRTTSTSRSWSGPGSSAWWPSSRSPSGCCGRCGARRPATSDCLGRESCPPCWPCRSSGS